MMKQENYSMLQCYGINSIDILEDGPSYISIVRNGDRNLKGNFLYVFVEKRTHPLHRVMGGFR